MSSGLYLVVDAINAIGAAAGNVAAGIVADAAAITSATAGMTGGSGSSGSQMGGAGGADPGSNTNAGISSGGGSMKVTVLTPSQLATELKALQGRTNPLAGQMGAR